MGDLYQISDLRQVGVSALREHLRSLPDGDVGTTEVTKIERLLAEAWGGLTGGSDEGMDSGKISGRTESLTWRRPILGFQIERHGGTVNGSSRAEMQHWKVDVEAGTAVVTSNSWRQLYPRASPVQFGPVAERIATSIERCQDEPSLRWIGADLVEVTMTKIPELRLGGPKETDAGRRRRFKAALTKRLATEWAVMPSSRLRFERREARDAPGTWHPGVQWNKDDPFASVVRFADGATMRLGDMTREDLDRAVRERVGLDPAALSKDAEQD